MNVISMARHSLRMEGTLGGKETLLREHLSGYEGFSLWAVTNTATFSLLFPVGPLLKKFLHLKSSQTTAVYGIYSFDGYRVESLGISRL